MVTSLVLALSWLPACRSDPLDPDALTGGPGVALPAISAAEVAERYNANLAHLDRLWARADVEVRWIEEDGDDRFEKGNGVLVHVPPRRVALTLSKLGKTALWAGSDDDRYWLIDNLGDGVAYVGTHAPRGDAPPPGGLPFRPDDVPHLLGLRPLPAPIGDGGLPPIEVYPDHVNGLYAVDVPAAGVWLYLEPRRLRPVRVELYDTRGRRVAVSRLLGHEPVEVEGVPEGGWPRIAGEAWLYPALPDGDLDARQSLQLRLETLTTRANKVKPRAFDFDTLLRAYDPDEVIDLDPPTRRVAPLPALPHP